MGRQQLVLTRSASQRARAHTHGMLSNNSSDVMCVLRLPAAIVALLLGCHKSIARRKKATIDYEEARV